MTYTMSELDITGYRDEPVPNTFFKTDYTGCTEPAIVMSFTHIVVEVAHVPGSRYQYCRSTD